MHRYEIQKFSMEFQCCSFIESQSRYFLSRPKLIKLYFVATRLELEAIRSYDKETNLL